ncbi:MAG: restriction endonuclease subunit S [Actinomycetota bacterium]|nr:restriction endonuclease subunit S [Actinomycetota bacterium]
MTAAATTRVKLADVADIVMGQSPPSTSYNVDGIGLPFLQGKAEFGALSPRPVKWCSDPKKIAEPGCVLLSVRAPVGDVNISDQRYCIGRGLAALVPGDNLDGQFLYYQLLTLRRWFESQSSGSIFQSINSGALYNLTLDLPDIQEQRRIARILSTIQSAKTHSQRVSAALVALRKALFQTTMTGTSKWPTVRLGDEITLQRGHDLPTQRRRQGPIPVISSSGVTGFHDEAKAYGPGVVIGRYGTLGSVTFVDGPYWPLNTTLYVKDFHGNNPSFVRFFLETIEYASHNDKTSVPGVNRNDLHALQVSWPPLREQTTIAMFLGTVASRIEVEASYEAAIEVLFASLLRELIDGDRRT